MGDTMRRRRRVLGSNAGSMHGSMFGSQYPAVSHHHHQQHQYQHQHQHQIGNGSMASNSSPPFARLPSVMPSSSPTRNLGVHPHSANPGPLEGSSSSSSSLSYPAHPSDLPYPHPHPHPHPQLYADQTSYMSLPQTLDSSDPFHRFWNLLETAFDQMSSTIQRGNPNSNSNSNPAVLFAGMDLDVPRGRGMDGGGGGGAKEKGKEKGKEKERDTEREKKEKKREKKSREIADLASSGADSFYLVEKENARSDSHAGNRSETSKSTSSSNPAKRQLPNKTLEELQFENESLRISLDTLSHHTSSLEKRLSLLQSQERTRDEALVSVVQGVKLEARKVRHEHEMLRSGILAGSVGGVVGMGPTNSGIGLGMANSPRKGIGIGLGNGSIIGQSRMVQSRSALGASVAHVAADLPGGHTDAGLGHGLVDPDPDTSSRVVQLERELTELKAEHERTRAHLQRYKDRFEKIKTSARAKRDAKLTAVGGQPATDLAEVGEEENEA